MSDPVPAAAMMPHCFLKDGQTKLNTKKARNGFIKNIIETAFGNMFISKSILTKQPVQFGRADKKDTAAAGW